MHTQPLPKSMNMPNFRALGKENIPCQPEWKEHHYWFRLEISDKTFCYTEDIPARSVATSRA